MEFIVEVIDSKKQKKEIVINALDRKSAISNIRSQGYLIIGMVEKQDELKKTDQCIEKESEGGGFKPQSLLQGERQPKDRKLCFFCGTWNAKKSRKCSSCNDPFRKIKAPNSDVVIAKTLLNEVTQELIAGKRLPPNKGIIYLIILVAVVFFTLKNTNLVTGIAQKDTESFAKERLESHTICISDFIKGFHGNKVTSIKYDMTKKDSLIYPYKAIVYYLYTPNDKEVVYFEKMITLSFFDKDNYWVVDDAVHRSYTDNTILSNKEWEKIRDNFGDPKDSYGYHEYLGMCDLRKWKEKKGFYFSSQSIKEQNREAHQNWLKDFNIQRARERAIRDDLQAKLDVDFNETMTKYRKAFDAYEDQLNENILRGN